MSTIPSELFQDIPFSKDPALYPNSEWTNTSADYDKAYYYYSGGVLKERVGPSKNDPLKYPGKINIVTPAVVQHAALMLGQVSNLKNIIKFGLSEESSKNTNVIDSMNKWWKLNNGDIGIMEQALALQVFGGAFYKLSLSVKRKSPVTFRGIDPRAVFPIYDESDHDRILSVDFVYQIPAVTALRLYRVNSNNGETVTVREHWDEDDYFIEVDGRYALWGDDSEVKGKNPFYDNVLGRKITPVVYAPRIKVTGEFYGTSLVPSLAGSQDELNTNVAHLSDGLADAMHQQVWIRNRKSGTKGLSTNRNHIMDLGSPQLGMDKPEVGRLAGAKIDKAVVDFAMDEYLKLTRESSLSPNVAWGRSDASVRSALTLHYMMMPSVNIGSHYRTNFAHALSQLHYKRMVMASTASGLREDTQVFTDNDIEDVLINHDTKWAPMLPQDRKDLINEVVQRVATETISIETSIRLLDGDEGVEEELKKIAEDIKKKEASAMKLVKQSTPKDQTNSAQAEGGRAKGGDK